MASASAVSACTLKSTVSVMRASVRMRLARAASASA
jgi:hypothetical protein